MDCLLKLELQAPIDITFQSEVIGKIKSFSVDLGDNPFWVPFPKVKIQISLYTKFHYADMIKSKLRKFKFIEIEEIIQTKKLETTLDDLQYEMIGK